MCATITTVNDLRCDELVEMVTAFLEDALGAEQALRVNAHLAICDGCDNHVAQVRMTIRALGNQPKELPSADFDRRLLDVFRNWHVSRTQ